MSVYLIKYWFFCNWRASERSEQDTTCIRCNEWK